MCRRHSGQCVRLEQHTHQRFNIPISYLTSVKPCVQNAIDLAGRPSANRLIHSFGVWVRIQEQQANRQAPSFLFRPPPPTPAQPNLPNKVIAETPQRRNHTALQISQMNSVLFWLYGFAPVMNVTVVRMALSPGSS